MSDSKTAEKMMKDWKRAFKIRMKALINFISVKSLNNF